LSPRPAPDGAALAAEVRTGSRRALARAITLVESTRADHRAQAGALLDVLLPHTGGAIRLGISGPPGVGKSTFIEALGLHITDAGQRLAVLAVDPTSARSGGSILGDKTRMERLTQAPRAFIRPSPSGTHAGGVAARTREAMLVCEAAGHDVVLVETVGVGQSEVAVAGMVDCFLLLQHPNAGDDLQAIKRGIVELADLIVVNKADLDEAAARRAAHELDSAVHLYPPRHPGWQVPVLLASARTGAGIPQVWDTVRAHHDALGADGTLTAHRRAQAVQWFWALVNAGLREAFEASGAVRAALPRALDAVASGRRSPSQAAADLLARYAGGSAPS
jgi:LAO/AO transport system kinase